jgi:hypothetical protein
MSGPVTPEVLAKDPSILLTNKFASGTTTTGKLLTYLVDLELRMVASYPAL